MSRRYAVLAGLLLLVAAGATYFFFFHGKPAGTPDTPGFDTPPTAGGRVESTPVPALELPTVEPAPSGPESIGPEPSVPEAPEPQPLVEDTMFPMAFVADVAGFVVDSYRPSNLAAEPELPRLTWKRINTRYGLDVSHFGHTAQSLPGAREQIYGYLLAPTVLRTLGGLYMEPFMDEVAARLRSKEFTLRGNDGVETRPLNPTERAVFYLRSAEFVRGGAKALAAMASDAGLAELIIQSHKAAADVLEAYAAYGEAENNDATKAELDIAGERIRQALLKRDTLRESAVARVRARAGNLPAYMTDNDILYLASWSARRLGGDPARRPALAAMSALLTELANRLESQASAPAQQQE